MTVIELIGQLLDCEMDSEVVLCDEVEIETENGNMNGSVYNILSVEPCPDYTFLNFDNRNHWKKVKK